MSETDNIVTIDTVMHGRPRITGTFLVGGAQTALVEAGPRSSLDATLEGLTVAGIESLDWVIVTHIHLDHAGAAGSLLQRFPAARVAVHEIGAPHLKDPTKLWSSASRIYGDRMEGLWGGMDPIQEDRIHVLRDGDEIDLGGRTLRAIETPGHAGHHHAFLDDATGTIFTGDALGVRLPEVGTIRPATPPPEFNLEQAVASIRRLGAMDPSAFCLTHFGLSDTGRAMTPAEACDRAVEALTKWAEWVKDARTRTTDLDEVAAEVDERARAFLRDQAAAGVDDAALDRMEQTTSVRMNTWGYMRYFDKRGE